MHHLSVTPRVMHSASPAGNLYPDEPPHSIMLRGLPNIRPLSQSDSGDQRTRPTRTMMPSRRGILLQCKRQSPTLPRSPDIHIGARGRCGPPMWSPRRGLGCVLLHVQSVARHFRVPTARLRKQTARGLIECAAVNGKTPARTSTQGCRGSQCRARQHLHGLRRPAATAAGRRITCSASPTCLGLHAGNARRDHVSHLPDRRSNTAAAPQCRGRSAGDAPCITRWFSWTG